jgi:hypothetical protein
MPGFLDTSPLTSKPAKKEFVAAWDSPDFAGQAGNRPDFTSFKGAAGTKTES